MKSRSNPFLEPTSTTQYGLSFLLNETTEAFDGARAHELHISVRSMFKCYIGMYVWLLVLSAGVDNTVVYITSCSKLFCSIVVGCIY